MAGRRPDPPFDLDGKRLPDDLRDRFTRLIDAIYAFDPLKPGPAIVYLAEQALRATARLTRSGWVSMSSYNLNRGRGPAMRLR